MSIMQLERNCLKQGHSERTSATPSLSSVHGSEAYFCTQLVQSP